MHSGTIQHLISRLLGLECWYVFTDPNTSEITVALGKKIPRVRKNPKFAEDDPRQYRGEYDLWIKSAWRLEYHNSVVAVCSDYGPTPDSALSRGIRAVFGKKITAIEAIPPAWDLLVHFDDGHSLKVFCNSSEHNGPGTAWTLGGPDGFLIAIGPKGRWTTDGNSPHDSW